MVLALLYFYITGGLGIFFFIIFDFAIFHVVIEFCVFSQHVIN